MNTVKKDPPWRQAVEDAVKEFTYGDFIAHEWLLEHFEIEFPKRGTIEQYEKFSIKRMEYMEEFSKSLLKNHFMLLENVRGKGYLIVKPEQQTKVVMGNANKGVSKLFKKYMEGLSYVNHSKLTQEQERENTEAYAKLGGLKLLMDRRLK